MPCQLDPEGREPRALLDVANFRGARVLEIGSGEGRLVLRYAHAAARVVGIEADATYVAAAARRRPPARDSPVDFVRADAARLPFRPDTFDIALLAWSL